MTRVKRSIIYDEIGDRLGRGRHGGREEVRTPDGVSKNLKRIALERAKLLVAHRHWAEVRKVFDNEIAFLAEVDNWVGGGLDQLDNAGMMSAQERYYREHGLKRPGQLSVVPEPAVAVDQELPLEDDTGRQLFHGRPRPRKKA